MTGPTAPRNPTFPAPPGSPAGSADAGGLTLDGRARTALGVAAFAAATAVSAQIVVPFAPVPMTLQLLFVVLAGVVLGPWAGASSMALYLAAGAAGAPVFSAGGAGLPWLLGPTGGYLVAMPAAAFVAGRVAGSDGRTLRTLAGLSLGVATVYAGGVAQLLLLGGGTPGQVLAVGVVPFLPADATKVLIALLVARMIRPSGPGRD